MKEREQRKKASQIGTQIKANPGDGLREICASQLQHNIQYAELCRCVSLKCPYADACIWKHTADT